MGALYWLSDVEWGRIEPLLARGRRGAQRHSAHAAGGGPLA